MKDLIKRIFKYMNDQTVDIRIRMMYFLEYAAFVACLIGTFFMALLKQSLESMLPNLLLLVFSSISLYFSSVKKKYEISTIFMIIGCANVAVPLMYFLAGGNFSGMLIWFIFSIAVTCMLSYGKTRVVMSFVTLIEDATCICVGEYFPKTVTPLIGENAVFIDVIQSFIIVSICLVVMLTIYVNTYENQSQKLEAQSVELKNAMYTDALTGTFNRRAYYDDLSTYKDSNQSKDFVLVAMDVNGLKKVNDLLGHAAGDDYIRAAANVIDKAMGQYGQIYRTGGDEFMAILHCSTEAAQNFENLLIENISKLETSWTEKMSIAIGVVCSSENPDMGFDDIEKLADKRMYENKAAYYRTNGIDRRK